MSKPKQPTRDEAIAQVAAQLHEPISLERFIQEVLAIWPSQAKNRKGSVRQAIRAYQQGETVVFLDDEALVPMQLALSGVRFHLPLSRQEVNQGILNVEPSLQFFLPGDLPPEKIQLVDESDQPIPIRVVSRQIEKRHLLGSFKYTINALNLASWYKKRKVKRQDSLLVTILDWTAAKLRFEPQSARDRRRLQSEIEVANQQLADILFALLEESKYEKVWGQEAIPTAYTRLKEITAEPADHWLVVINNDPRMRFYDDQIHYADAPTFVEQLVPELRQQRPSASRKLSPQQREQAYRFKAHYKHRKGLWRRIEIQGGQTLEEFDSLLRDAFQEDSWDHLSGFWRLERRGNTRRFREIALGRINPMERRSGAGKQIATLNLEPGSALKYIYDFGDWREYRIELEEIVAPEEGAEYPRVIEQNKPRYKYCPICKEEGRKTVATHICISCSNRQEQEVLMCKACMGSRHEEHTLARIVY